jgi:hypothetical protein
MILQISNSIFKMRKIISKKRRKNTTISIIKISLPLNHKNLLSPYFPTLAKQLLLLTPPNMIFKK